jgi:ABC-type lipoprotein release transport system permease subunit
MSAMIWSFAWKGFLRRKSRFAASVLGFSLAVLVFATVRAISTHSQRSIGRVLTHTGTHFIAYKPFCCSPPFLNQDANEGFFANGIPSQPLPANLLEEIRRLPSVAEAAPFLLFRVTEDESAMMIGGFDPKDRDVVANTSCSANDLVEGRFLAPEDSLSALAEQSFAVIHNLHAGSIVRVKGMIFQIVGVVNPGIRPAKADLYLPIRDAERVIGASASMPVKGLMNIILVESVGAHEHRRAMADAQKILGGSGLISSYGCYQPASLSMKMNDKVMRWLSWVTFLFAMLLAFKTQAGSVNERRHDIGILSSMGWSKFQITALMSIEALIQAGIGAFFGAVVYVLTAPALIRGLAGTDSEESIGISFGVVALAVGFTFFSGLIAGILPAWNATRMKPVRNLNRL